MAFPSVADYATSSGSGTSHVITIPPRNAGDIIVLCYETWAFPDGPPSDLDGAPWTELASHTSAYYAQKYVWWARASSSSGSSATVTVSGSVTGSSQDFAAVACRIAGAHTEVAPEAASIAFSADPPALDPSGWAAADTLWLALHMRGASGGVTGFPTGYSLIADYSAADMDIAVASRSTATASENPSAFTGPYSGSGFSATVAMPPATLVLNTAPVARAGADQTVTEGDIVYLDGTGSSDPDGDTLDYEWTVLDDGGTGLTNADITGRLTATPSFTAPEV